MNRKRIGTALPIARLQTKFPHARLSFHPATQKCFLHTMFCDRHSRVARAAWVIRFSYDHLGHSSALSTRLSCFQMSYSLIAVYDQIIALTVQILCSARPLRTKCSQSYNQAFPYTQLLPYDSRKIRRELVYGKAELVVKLTNIQHYKYKTPSNYQAELTSTTFCNED